jgi:hypothetical protein
VVGDVDRVAAADREAESDEKTDDRERRGRWCCCSTTPRSRQGDGSDRERNADQRFRDAGGVRVERLRAPAEGVAEVESRDERQRDCLEADQGGE